MDTVNQILFIGDTHGKIDDLFKLASLKEGPPKDTLILQLGDMGLGFRGVFLPHLPENFKFIRGNHDSPGHCRLHPNYLGDYGYIEELQLFYLGGAFSVDCAWRIPGVSWWQDEELSYPSLQKAIDLYERCKPKLVATHECPASISQAILRSMFGRGIYSYESSYASMKSECAYSRTALGLQEMFERHRPEKWVFGHYHKDWDMEVQGTQFRCCAELSLFCINVKEG